MEYERENKGREHDETIVLKRCVADFYRWTRQALQTQYFAAQLPKGRHGLQTVRGLMWMNLMRERDLLQNPCQHVQTARRSKCKQVPKRKQQANINKTVFWTREKSFVIILCTAM